MKSVLVIGMGRFGRFLAGKMLELNNDVMIIDKNPDIIDELAPKFTNAQIGDCTNPDVLKAIGVDSFDVCFVAFDENFQSSLEITSLLSELGASNIVAMASRETQAKFLKKVGASEVVYPEKDVAETLAIRYSANNVYDYIQLTKDYSIFEIPVLAEWVKHSIGSLNIRSRYNINILAIKKEGILNPSPNPEYIFTATDHVVVLGIKDEVLKLAAKTKSK